MAMALSLAQKGLNTTHPNPRVGCVIADGENILGQGWHEFAGGPHAEIVALREAGEPSRGNTVYVTLEPCSHHGLTAPCVDALVEAGVKRVVIAVEDPNPQVNGAGIRRLSEAGIAVDTGLMETQAEALNCGFLSRMRLKRPWVRIKAAQSLDGRTALENGRSRWISCGASRRDVQRWRARSSAVLTGIGTVLADNPSMNARVLKDQEAVLRQPLRVIVDSRWRTPPGSRILADPDTALIAGDREAGIPESLADTGVRCLPLVAKKGRVDLQALMQTLANEGSNEVQVEAGAVLCGALLKARLVDEILIYQAPVLLGDGGPGAFAIGPLESMDKRTHLRVLETRHIGADLRLRMKPEYRS
jgi:diaminohydroxyphosphoribosylaminopyrimidine deaminase/5-amino-6-(5-phosphoribosylamino)uracil reductase